jgi:hypothetical protein
MPIESLAPWIVLIAAIAFLMVLGLHDHRAGYRTSRSISPIGDGIRRLAEIRQPLSRAVESSKARVASSTRISPRHGRAVFTWELTASADSKANFRMVNTRLDDSRWHRPPC